MTGDRPKPPHSVRCSQGQTQLDEICDAFEREWQTGHQPSIEAFLQGVDELLRHDHLRELIALDIEYRRRSGSDVARAEYDRRFPADADAVREAFQLLNTWRQTSADVSSAVHAANAEPEEYPERRLLDELRTVDSESPPPPRFGRYEIQEVLGSGGFGTVYRATDPQLQREVALKVPHRSRIGSAQRCAMYLQEARAAARLKHPGLVSVYDVQQETDTIYIVQEYVDGQDLRQWVTATAPDLPGIVRLMMEVVEAVGCAHQEGLVHRDLKPANILVDRRGHAHVADFGLALDESLQQLKQGETCGTPAYMSPEQVRGESHRLDGRSDLWSLGVILYEVLSGRRPFGGDSASAMFDEITHRDPKPPRMLQPEIPAELERIALKCLAKRATDRYGSAAELLEDLKAWLTQGEGSAGDAAPQPATGLCEPRVIPKGLRCFDAQDADFFLELLPGTRDREGVPECLRLWKTRIEQTDSDQTFSVGLMYGPSGCGKSSLVQAGLLPRLAPHVIPIYVESTATHTEIRLLKRLRHRFPQAPPEIDIAELFAGLRDGLWTSGNEKILVIFDQFEQWLHAHRGQQDQLLLDALRHCDGGRLQCLLLVRDDFWLAISRLMDSLEVDFVPGQNCAMVDLFDPPHARHVLAQFGRAYGTLPVDLRELTADQEAFLDSAVQGLTQDGKVICVHLALFADMVKAKPWNKATLKQVGGIAGLGVAFLEESLSSANAPAAHRYHLRAAQAVLEALLPDSDTNIRGHMRSDHELMQKSGYARRVRDFAELTRVLERDLRLITPTDPEGVEATSEPAGKADGSNTTYYHLTHDFLVPPLRTWLSSRQSAWQKIRHWAMHPNRIREAGIVTTGLASLFFVLHVGVILLCLAFRWQGSTSALTNFVTGAGTVRLLATMLSFICLLDIPYFVLGLGILRKSCRALVITITLDVVVVLAAAVFLLAPALHPLYTGSAEAVISRWIVIGFIVGPLIAVHTTALFACRHAISPAPARE